MRGTRRARIVGSLVALWLAASTATAGEWTQAPAMSTPRAHHTMTLLSDGRVLVAGGIPTFKETTVNAVSEVWSDAWTGAAPMHQGRFEHAAALLPDGRVLVAGGQYWTTNLVTAEIFDPASGAWSLAAPMLTARHWCTATALPDGRVLVAGGFDSTDPSALASAELYDPAGDVWSPAADMNVPRGEHTATLLADGRVLVTGGLAKWNHTGARDTAEIYDPASDTWSPAGRMSEARGEHTATRLPDGRVLVAGGLQADGPETFRAGADVYAPETGAWIAAGSMHRARAGHIAVALGNGRVLIAGGHASAMLADAELYDPLRDTWTEEPPMHDARDYFAAALLPDGRVLVAGGSIQLDAPGKTLAETEIYTPTTGTSCASGADCPTGACVDGICCDAPCQGTCGVCSRARGAPFDGTCTYLPRDADGACVRSCTSVHDCVPPAVCNAEGRCAAPPPVVSDASGCHVPGGAPDGAPRVIAAALALAAALARRRGRRAVAPGS